MQASSCSIIFYSLVLWQRSTVGPVGPLANFDTDQEIGAGEGNRTLVISLEGGCDSCPRLVYSDKTPPSATIDPQRLFPAVRMARNRTGVRSGWSERYCALTDTHIHHTSPNENDRNRANGPGRHHCSSIQPTARRQPGHHRNPRQNGGHHGRTRYCAQYNKRSTG